VVVARFALVFEGAALVKPLVRVGAHSAGSRALHPPRGATCSAWHPG
jgi:hypothetical protein